MSHRPHIFRQADVTRAIRGALAAGVKVRQVAIDNTGHIVIIMDPESEAQRPASLVEKRRARLGEG